MFSHVASRLPGEPNALYQLRDKLKAEGRTILDLISGNVTEHGLLFPQQLLEDILLRSSRRSMVYRPDSFGQRPARDAISRHYHAQGIPVPAENILLTPGTSVSYWYCFKLLADEGDEILCPCPSYPLFEYIGALCGIKLVPYRLDEASGWSIDIDHLDACVSTRTRAIVLISPHNPTGHVSQLDEIAAVSQLASRHDLAIISDEVFSEFLFAANHLPRIALESAPLVFTLNGFSKMFALPGLKLGWMAVSGHENRVRSALRALELISDTFLPVNEIVQAAVPEIFAKGWDFLDSYRAEIRRRWRVAEQLLRRRDRWDFVPPQGGFYVTLRLQDIDEQDAAETILRERGILLHPGYFYDMDPPHLVLSFVPKPERLRSLLTRVLETLQGIQ